MPILERDDEAEVVAQKSEKSEAAAGSEMYGGASQSGNASAEALALAARQKREGDALAEASTEKETAEAKTKGRVSVGDMELPEIRLDIRSLITETDIDQKLREIASEHGDAGAFRLILDGSSAVAAEGEIQLTMGLEIGSGFEQHVFVEREGAEHSHLKMPDFISSHGSHGFHDQFLQCWFIGMGTAAHWIMELLGAIDAHLGGVMKLDHAEAIAQRKEVSETKATGSQSKFAHKEKREGAGQEAPPVAKQEAPKEKAAPKQEVQKAVAEKAKDPVEAVKKREAETAAVPVVAEKKETKTDAPADETTTRDAELQFPVELAGYGYETQYARAEQGGSSESRVEIAGALAGLGGENSADRVRELLLEVFDSLEALGEFSWSEKITDGLCASIAERLGNGTMDPECRTRLIFQWSEQDGQLQMFGAGVLTEGPEITKAPEETAPAALPHLISDADDATRRIRTLPDSVDAATQTAPKKEAGLILELFDQYAESPEQLSAFIEALVQRQADLTRLGRIAESCGFADRLAGLSAIAQRANIDLRFSA